MSEWLRIFIPFHNNGHLFNISPRDGEITIAFGDWLYSQFGTQYSGSNPDGTWHITIQQVNGFYGREVWFRDKKEAMLFKLTWL